MHDLFKHVSARSIDKKYKALVIGKWPYGEHLETSSIQVDSSSKVKVSVSNDESAKKAKTLIKPLAFYHFEGKDYTLVEAKLLTGRMHQIRVHLSNLGYPIVGDRRYGDFKENRRLKQMLKINRLFLHAFYTDFYLSVTKKTYNFKLDLSNDLQHCIEQLTSIQP